MPYAKTLYGMFLKGNVLDKCQEKANQTAGFSSTCAAHSLDCIQQPRWIPRQPSSGVIPLLGTLVPTVSHRVVPLFSSCPWLWLIVFLHTVKGTAAHSWSQPFWGPPPLQSHAQGKRRGCRKGSSR